MWFCFYMCFFFFFFVNFEEFYFVFCFFQAEDGLRDRTVTGVQTCALPISHHRHEAAEEDDGTAVSIEQPLGEIEIVPRDQNVPAVLQDEGPPSPGGDRVG